MDNILIGTSGYDYPEWKGVFYPPVVKRADFLSYYATQFNAVELNSTFYNMPTADRLLSFYERSEGKLEFSIKANRLLTHEISPQWTNAADDFKQALLPLLEKDKLCSVLFQFPQSFHYTNDNRIYLAKVIEAFKNFPVVIEFRHKEWIRQSVFEGLLQRKVSLAFRVSTSSTTGRFAITQPPPLSERMPISDFTAAMQMPGTQLTLREMEVPDMIIIILTKNSKSLCL